MSKHIYGATDLQLMEVWNPWIRPQNITADLAWREEVFAPQSAEDNHYVEPCIKASGHAATLYVALIPECRPSHAGPH